MSPLTGIFTESVSVYDTITDREESILETDVGNIYVSGDPTESDTKQDYRRLASGKDRYAYIPTRL